MRLGSSKIFAVQKFFLFSFVSFQINFFIENETKVCGRLYKDLNNLILLAFLRIHICNQL